MNAAEAQKEPGRNLKTDDKLAYDFESKFKIIFISIQIHFQLFFKFKVGSR